MHEETFKAVITLLGDHTQWESCWDNSYKVWKHKTKVCLYCTDGGTYYISGNVHMHSTFGYFQNKKIHKAVDKMLATKMLVDGVDNYEEKPTSKTQEYPPWRRN